MHDWSQNKKRSRGCPKNFLSAPSPIDLIRYPTVVNVLSEICIHIIILLYILFKMKGSLRKIMLLIELNPSLISGKGYSI